MTLNFETSGQLTIDMRPYIKAMFEEMPESMKGASATPAATYLFDTRNSAPKLEGKDKDQYHSMSAKLLYLSQFGWPDICTAAAFLSTRVQSPDKDNKKKLGKVMKYLQSTLDKMLTIKSGDSVEVIWYVDASYGVHPDRKSHTGTVMMFNGGAGAVYTTSNRQKIMTRSLTEAELVAVHGVFPQVIWARNFLSAQGFVMGPSTVFQDNKSAILLEKNGQASSGKHTRHIDVRYFFAKDCVESGNIKIEHCPTKDMLADFFTNPYKEIYFGSFGTKY